MQCNPPQDELPTATLRLVVKNDKVLFEETTGRVDFSVPAIEGIDSVCRALNANASLVDADIMLFKVDPKNITKEIAIKLSDVLSRRTGYDITLEV